MVSSETHTESEEYTFIDRAKRVGFWVGSGVFVLAVTVTAIGVATNDGEVCREEVQDNGSTKEQCHEVTEVLALSNEMALGGKLTLGLMGAVAVGSGVAYFIGREPEMEISPAEFEQ